MRNLRQDPGCLYDTVAFLSRYLEEASGGTESNRPDSPYYKKIKDRLTQGGIAIPHYLYPFACRYRERRPFLYLLFFDGRQFGECTYEQTMTKVKNNQHLRWRYIEHYFGSSDQRTVFRKLAAHPDGIELIKRQGFDPSIETYIYYTLLRFDEVALELAAVLESLYTVVENVHKEFISQRPEFISSLQSDAITGKLKALGKIKNEALLFSFTLLDVQKIDFSDEEPGFVLLGYKFEETLDARHKYINATPYSFAQVIGHLPRYEIYQALLEKSPMTRADMEKRLHLSRAALDHNLKVMCDSGILVVDHQSGLTNYYRLDYEYIRVAAGLMLESVKG